MPDADVVVDFAIRVARVICCAAEDYLQALYFGNPNLHELSRANEMSGSVAGNEIRGNLCKLAGPGGERGHAYRWR